MVDPTQLVDLRAMLERAVALSRHRGRLDRVQAVVALDAAVERALYMALTANNGATGKKGGVDDLLSKVRQAVPGVPTKDVAAIKMLHRARNAAQHEGLAPAAEQMDQFVTAVDRFVPDVVGTCLKADLRKAALRDLIRNLQWRAEIEGAENLAAAGELSKAITQLSRIRAEVRSRFESWLKLRTRPKRHLGFDFGWDDSDEQLDKVKNRAVIDRLIPDPAEDGWFTRLGGEAALASLEDAERAIAYVTWLAYNFESSPAAEERDRSAEELKRRLERWSCPGDLRVAEYRYSTSAHSKDSMRISVQFTGFPATGLPQGWLRTLEGLTTNHDCGIYWHFDTSGLAVTTRAWEAGAASVLLLLDGVRKFNSDQRSSLELAEHALRQREEEARRESQAELDSVIHQVPSWLVNLWVVSASEAAATISAEMSRGSINTPGVYTLVVGWPGGIAPPGSHRSRRDSLPSPGSCHLGHQNAAFQAQWAKSRGYWRVMRCQHALAFWNGRSRRYFLRIQRIR